MVPFDLAAVEAVAGLNLRIRDARRAIESEGTMIDSGNGLPVEHPALAVEKRASQEIRGWVQARPDLFGERKGSARKLRRPNPFQGDLKAVN
nr:P27 family phage terminase small subunit [Corynebacterium pygosceleis]